MSAPLVNTFHAIRGLDISKLYEGGTCTEWNATSFENVVRAGNAVYYNLPVLNPAAMAIGNVLLLKTTAKPIILGLLVRASADVTDSQDG